MRFKRYHVKNIPQQLARLLGYLKVMLKALAWVTLMAEMLDC